MEYLEQITMKKKNFRVISFELNKRANQETQNSPRIY